MRQRLTDLGVERIKAPKSGRLEIWDSLLPRFGLRVTANGRKSWVVMYRMGGRKAPKRRLTLGPYTNPPPIGTVRGPAGIRAVLEPFFAPTLENEFKFLREAASGDVVLVERLDRHHLADKWVELPVTGVFEVHEGVITYWRDYFDAATIMTQWPTA